MTERTTVRLPEELLVRAKRKAAAEGRTLTALLEEGLRRILSDRPVEGRIRRMPRVSEACGGFRPDLDDLSGSDPDEAEDLAYARRLRDGFR
jgi:hypothetical protein